MTLTTAVQIRTRKTDFCYVDSAIYKFWLTKARKAGPNSIVPFQRIQAHFWHTADFALTLYDHKEIAGFYDRAGLYEHVGHPAVPRAIDSRLHLHGLY